MTEIEDSYSASLDQRVAAKFKPAHRKRSFDPFVFDPFVFDPFSNDSIS
jgi:hypothetical protein